MTDTIITCAATLFGVLLGSYLSSVNQKEINKKEKFGLYIADVFAHYAEYAGTKSTESFWRLISSIKRASLYADEKTTKHLSQLVDAFLELPPNPNKCGELMVLIHHSSKEFLEN